METGCGPQNEATILDFTFELDFHFHGGNHFIDFDDVDAERASSITGLTEKKQDQHRRLLTQSNS